MEITEVKVFPVNEEKLRAFVSLVIDDCFMVNDIKIIQGRESRFISMPSRRKKNGDFKDVAHPLNNETRRMMEDRILAEYDRVTAGREVEAGAPAQQEQRRPKPEQEKRKPDVEQPQPGRSEPGPAQAQRPQAKEDDAEAGSMEEVAEKHLSDSFWST